MRDENVAGYFLNCPKKYFLQLIIRLCTKLGQDAPTYRQRVSLDLPRQETEGGLLPGIWRRHLPPQLVTNGGAEERVLARGLDGQNSSGSSRSSRW